MKKEEKDIELKDAGKKEKRFSDYRLPSITDFMNEHGDKVDVVLYDMDIQDDNATIKIMHEGKAHKIFTISKSLIQALRNAQANNILLPVGATLKAHGEEGRIYYTIE